MFSTSPSTGTLTFSNIVAALRASISATSCGVVTMMAPQNGRRRVVEQKAHRHQLEIVLFDRDDFVFVGRGWSFARAEHQGNAWTVNVAVAQTDARLRLFKRDGEICRDGRFSNATFATRNCNDMLYSRNLGGADTRARAGRWRVDIDQHFCAANTIELTQDPFGIVFNCRGNVGIIGGEGELHFDFTAINLDTFNETERHNVATKSRITDRAQRIANLLF